MLITLTTDFGLRDSFAGIMKGVIAAINPTVPVVDLTHGIPPQNVLAGALTLWHAVRYFPRGTIHVAVVDPGVGSARRPLLIECDGSYFIGPDNGLLSMAIGDKKPEQIIQLSNPAYQLTPTSSTFHGRDVFAPAAAHLSRGAPVTSFGEPLASYDRVALPKPSRSGSGVEGEIIYVDSFGNLFTNIEERDLTELADQSLEIIMDPVRIRGLAPSYTAVPAGEFVAVVNSWGLLELAVYRGSAQQRSGANIGDKVRLVIAR